MYFYNTHTLIQHKQLAFGNLTHRQPQCIFIDSHFTFQKSTTQTQTYTLLYIHYSRCLFHSQYYILQSYLYIARAMCYKAECKEKQTLNRVLTRNWILKHFSPFPTHCTSLSISRDSQRTEVHINHYKTTNYAYFPENKRTTFQRKKQGFLQEINPFWR